MATYDVVVAAENNQYLQWQAMMLHYSAAQVLDRPPIFVVHMDDEPLLPGFRLIREHGGIVQQVPTLRYLAGVEYPPRNSAAALQAVQTTADFVILCDADMIFLRPLPVDELGLPPDTMTFDRVDFLNPEKPEHSADMASACRADGIDPEILRRAVVHGGVPHVIPRCLLTDLGREWLRCMDLFPTIEHPLRPNLPRHAWPKGPHRPWMTAMWAFSLAVHRLQLSLTETKWCLNNKAGKDPMPSLASADECLLHYCFGEPAFDKRLVRCDIEITDPGFWSVPPDNATISGFLRRQFRDTARFFGLAGETVDVSLTPECQEFW